MTPAAYSILQMHRLGRREHAQSQHGVIDERQALGVMDGTLLRCLHTRQDLGFRAELTQRLARHPHGRG